MVFTPQSAAAAVYYMIHSTFATAMLFLVADLVTERRGGEIAVQRLTDQTGRVGVLDQARGGGDGARCADADGARLTSLRLDPEDQITDRLHGRGIVGLRCCHAAAQADRAFGVHCHGLDLRAAQINADAHPVCSGQSPNRRDSMKGVASGQVSARWCASSAIGSIGASLGSATKCSRCTSTADFATEV